MIGKKPQDSAFHFMYIGNITSGLESKLVKENMAIQEQRKRDYILETIHFPNLLLM